MSMKKLVKALNRIKRDERGVSAIEFAFIAPILLTFYFGCVELSMLLQADRKVTSVASAVADLITQDDEVNAGELDDVFAAATAIMQPFSAASVKMRATSLRMDSTGKVVVGWSHGKGLAANACSATIAVPAGLLAPGQSVVLAEVEMNYTFPVAQSFVGDSTLKDTFYLRPRRSAEVAFIGAGACPA
jgi:Flp pilus assembly protein TadG